VHSHILPQNVSWFIPALLHVELVGLPLPLLLELLLLLQVGVVAAALAPGFGLAMLLQHLLGTSLHVEGDLGEHVGEVVHVKPRGFDLVTRLRALHEPVLGLLSRRVVVGAAHVGEDLLGTKVGVVHQGLALLVGTEVLELFPRDAEGVEGLHALVELLDDIDLVDLVGEVVENKCLNVSRGGLQGDVVELQGLVRGSQSLFIHGGLDLSRAYLPPEAGEDEDDSVGDVAADEDGQPVYASLQNLSLVAGSVGRRVLAHDAEDGAIGEHVEVCD